MKVYQLLSVSALISLLAACSAERPLEPISADTSGFQLPTIHESEPPSQTLSDYAQYKEVLTAAKQGDAILPAQFLSRQTDSAMAENVRNAWLIALGKQGNWAQFSQEYAKLAPQGRSQEVECYAENLKSGKSSLAEKLVWKTGRLPEGCTRLIENQAAQGYLNTKQAWRRVRGLIGNNRITDARNLAQALGSPLDSTEGQGAQENLLRNIITPPVRQDSAAAAARLENISGSLTSEQQSYAWGVLGYATARDQNMAEALSYFARADRSQLSTDQFEWYARAALRLQRWQDLVSIINDMPNELKESPDWQYWLGRSLSALGRNSEAKKHFQAAANSGRNFYAVLAHEELGKTLSVNNNVGTAKPQNVDLLAQDGAINRALTLFHTSQNNSDWSMRRAAQAEWRYATRDFNETTLLTAAKLADNHHFYEMSIYSADKTDHKLDFNLRYPTPFRNQITDYATQAGIDPAWVLGLIRQESRFMIGAQSSVGAHGLMQVMPATAREIARKIGMDDSELYTIDGNIRMGTWYMADGQRRLSNSEVLATAGYNAGPSRARRWQANVPLEGAIYAETIPFDETRDYVKKVMTNTTYYSHLLGHSAIPLKQRLGTIPAQ